MIIDLSTGGLECKVFSALLSSDSLPDDGGGDHRGNDAV